MINIQAAITLPRFEDHEPAYVMIGRALAYPLLGLGKMYAPGSRPVQSNDQLYVFKEHGKPC